MLDMCPPNFADFQGPKDTILDPAIQSGSSYFAKTSNVVCIFRKW
jgi:hypothetical protein